MNFAGTTAGLIQKLGNSLGSSDINFPSHPEFSRKYQLGGEDETAVRQLFHPEVLEFFESQGRGVSLEASGNRFILYRRQLSVSPKKIREFMAEGYQVFQMLKSAQDKCESVGEEKTDKEACTVVFE